jgi:NAD-dependent protein deacetylase/lipoamidase
MTAVLEQAAELVARGDVVAFTGAGISAESGIPTFRDPGGLWDRYDPMRFGTFEGIAQEAMEHPDELAEYLTEMKLAFSQAYPNPGHVALAELERAGLVIGLVTQNVDGLHREAGSSTVVEVHGSNRRRVCLSCGNLEEIGREEYLASMERTILRLRTAFVPSYQSLMPRCSVCGGPARPDVVAFGEAVKDFGAAERLAERAQGHAGRGHLRRGLPGGGAAGVRTGSGAGGGGGGDRAHVRGSRRADRRRGGPDPARDRPPGPADHAAGSAGVAGFAKR